MYLAEEDQANRRARKKAGGNSGKMYTEGWIEFEDKKIARGVTVDPKHTAYTLQHSEWQQTTAVLLTSLYYVRASIYSLEVATPMAGLPCAFETKPRPPSVLLTKEGGKGA